MPDWLHELNTVILSGANGVMVIIALCSLSAAGVAIILIRRRDSRIQGAEIDLVAREERMQRAINSSNDGLWHWNVLTGAAQFSARANELLDYRPDELESRGRVLFDLLHPEDLDAVRDSLHAHLQKSTPYEREFRLRLKSGAYGWFRLRGQIEHDAEGRAIDMAGSITDISDRKQADMLIGRHAMQQGLIAEFGQFALEYPSLSDLMNHAMTVVTRGLPAEFCRLLVTEGDEKTLVLMGASGWSPDWLARRHYDPAEETEDRFIIGVREAVLIDDFSTEARFKASPMLSAHDVRSGAEMLICGAEDSYGFLGIYSRDPGQFSPEDVNFLRGITNILASSMDQNLASERLTYMAQFDALTGLPNRTMLLDRLWHMITKAEREQQAAGVIFVDLDRFKLVNDTLGHDAGDNLLLQVAQRLLSCMRPEDIVGRLGGDEFAVALANLDGEADAGTVSLAISGALAEPFDVAGQAIYISASLGIAIYPRDGKDPHTLLKNADTAMYRAKESGRNTYEFYAPQMNERAVERLKIETELRGALERGEFVVYYQPKADILTQEISGFEALLRWQHPDRGLVPPIEFIAILEETDLIIPVGEWVIRTVCLQLCEWRASQLPLRPVAINLSARQFKQADLDAVVNGIVLEVGIDPGLLEFELTESILMSDSEAAVRTLKNFKSLGIRISVDDFGTGYSSLAYLRRFPLDALKIDRAFIRDVTTEADGATIVLAIINLAHSLKLKVVAEGVETAAQLQFLKKHGCDEIQGYLFARPQPAEGCTRALLEGLSLRPFDAVHWLVRQA